mmetsp:Transcript_32243/g.54667  ORF Transcript_32243/g.54667 Transcript_32243/m.54667 type:complete len:588 (-) Transcript_32243:993-2756(-)
MEAQHRSKRRKTSRKEEGLLQKMKGFVGEKADLSLLRYFLAKASNDYIDAIQLYYTAKEEDNEAGCILEESDREAHEEILKKSVLNGVGVHPGMQIRVEWNLRDERKGCDADVKVVDGRIITVSYKGSYKGKEQTIDLDGTEFDITLLPAQTERPLQPVKTIILRDFKRLQNPEEYSQKLSVKSRSAKKSTPKRKKTRKSATTSSSARKHWFSTGVTSRKGNGENAENTNPLGLALKNVAQSQKPTSSHDENPQHSSKLLRQDGKVDTSRSPLLSVLTTASEQNTQALSETIVMSPPEGKVFKKPRGIRNGTKKQASSRRCGKRCKGATAFTNGEGITTTTMSPAVNQNRRKMGKKSKRAVAAGVGGGASSSSSSPLMLSKVANLKSSCPSAGSTSRRRGGKTTTTSSSSSSAVLHHNNCDSSPLLSGEAVKLQAALLGAIAKYLKSLIDSAGFSKLGAAAASDTKEASGEETSGRIDDDECDDDVRWNLPASLCTIVNARNLWLMRAASGGGSPAKGDDDMIYRSKPGLGEILCAVSQMLHLLLEHIHLDGVLKELGTHKWLLLMLRLLRIPPRYLSGPSSSSSSS